MLETDPTTGVLSHYNPDRQELHTQADVERYIFQEKEAGHEQWDGQGCLLPDTPSATANGLPHRTPARRNPELV